MPNHVTTILKSSPAVIAHLIKDGRVDFNTVIPSFEDGQGGCIMGHIETLAESCVPFDDGQFLAGMKSRNILNSDVTKLDDDSFGKFIKMLKNKREHGYFHGMEFNREKWGTKWNAYESLIESDQVTFQTAWSHPLPVMVALSKLFPNEELAIQYADEDTGSNCGFFTLKGGETISENIAPDYNKQGAEEKKRWTRFAFELCNKGCDPAEYGYDSDWNFIEE